MSQLTLQHFLALAAILFATGLFAVITRKNSIAILLGVELMLNAANINLIAFQRFLAPVQIVDVAGKMYIVELFNLAIDGQIFALIVITLAACEAAVGLAIILNVYRTLRTTTADEVSLLKW
ncbi:MAG TPA: NADH-quinone oxidoreductase subunit NuoK [Armatimonadota bacterium]|nr:NADH-quinone oxidoreductase subunit NuoK [Armatimonadota bacterium]